MEGLSGGRGRKTARSSWTRGPAHPGCDSSARAARFLEANLQYPNSSFDAILLWDLLDYLEPVVSKQMVANLTELLRPGGVVFAMFHSKKPEGFRRYRVVDSTTLQVIS